MPQQTIIVIAAILIAFGAFAFALAYADYQTRLHS